MSSADLVGSGSFSDLTLYLPITVELNSFSNSTARQDRATNSDFSLLTSSSTLSLWPGGRQYSGVHEEQLIGALLTEYNRREKSDFSVKLSVETGTFVCEIFLRVKYFQDKNRHVFHARRQPKHPFSWRELNIAPQAQSELLHPRLSAGGLVVICGSVGEGKTTVINSLINARVQAYGGVCITIEDPVEVPQPEFVVCKKNESIGHIIQREYDNPEDCPAIVRETLRSYPANESQNIMVVGECRDSETASLILESAIDGRLIITTVHANDPISGLQRIAGYAAKKNGDEAYNQLADAFRVSYHQSLPLIDGVPTPVSNFIVDTSKFAALARARNWSGMRQEYNTFFSRLRSGSESPKHRSVAELRDGLRGKGVRNGLSSKR